MLVAEGPRHGITVFSAPRVNLDGEPISSTRIRERIGKGDMKGTAALLGYAYTASGTVVHGKHLGRKIGFPTLNLGWSPDLRPLYGVYAVRVSGAKSYGWLPAVANYGLRPTVEEALEPRLEIHMLVTCPYAAGDPVAVEWVGFFGRRGSSQESTNCAPRSQGTWRRRARNFPCRDRRLSCLISNPLVRTLSSVG